MSYRNWIKLLGLLLAINIIAFGLSIYGKKKYQTAWNDYKEIRTSFMSNCESEGRDWSACWESFNKDLNSELKTTALEKAHPFNSKNSNQFFGYAITSFGTLAGMILISIFLRAAYRFFRR